MDTVRVEGCFTARTPSENSVMLVDVVDVLLSGVELGPDYMFNLAVIDIGDFVVIVPRVPVPLLDLGFKVQEGKSMLLEKLRCTASLGL